MSVTAERLQLAAEVRRLRDEEGFLFREIQAQLGISYSYANALYNDPEGVQQRRRRESYTGACKRCGGETKSNGTSTPSPHCENCARAIARENPKWTREAIIDAIQRFARANGRPPTATDWKRSDLERGYPPSSSVYASSNPSAPFPKWADAIEAAGFPRPRSGQYEPRERQFVCRGCQSAFTYRGRGPVRRLCHECRVDDATEKQRAYREANKDEIAEKQRAYREANKDEIAEKKRAYYEANKDEIAEKKRAYREANKDEIAAGRKLPGSKWHCGECGEPLRRNTEDGLCGFCRQGAAKPDDEFETLFAELSA